MDLRGKAAVVTGGAHRVGKHIALALAAEGMDLLVHYHRSEGEAERTRSQIAGLGVRAEMAQADLSGGPGCRRLFEAVQDHFGRVDVLVNSAASMEAIGFAEATEADWDRILNTNLKSAFLCSQHAARMMAPAGGLIVNIADLSALRPWPAYAVHSVSKAGLIALTEVMAKALAPAIRVNAVAPGPVLKAPGWDDDRWAALGRRTALRRVGSPQDVARAVVYLATAEYVTGETIVVDGGRRLM